MQRMSGSLSTSTYVLQNWISFIVNGGVINVHVEIFRASLIIAEFIDRSVYWLTSNSSYLFPRELWPSVRPRCLSPSSGTFSPRQRGLTAHSGLYWLDSFSFFWCATQFPLSPFIVAAHHVLMLYGWLL
ncbi:hypothetical protein C8R45DRAFT_1019768 [Mycena sanguinolenta]|nr:hypothetical protein C8R45DRAFT_1019768 [Mycena sanguinolenta]